MTAQEIQERLQAYFSAGIVKFKPQASKGDRALPVAYISARDVMNRLDEVVGVGGWQDEYMVLADGSVVCQLRLKIDGEWLTKSDVGGQSTQPDAGDRLKSAYSESLKRAAVHWGIARYLYNLPLQWCGFDPQKKQFTQTPQLPAWALPKPSGQQQQQAQQQNQPAQQPQTPQAATVATSATPPAGADKFVRMIGNCNTAVEQEAVDGAIAAAYQQGQFADDALPAIHRANHDKAVALVRACRTADEYKDVAGVLTRSVHTRLPADLKTSLATACKEVKNKVDPPAPPPDRDPLYDD